VFYSVTIKVLKQVSKGMKMYSEIQKKAAVAIKNAMIKNSAWHIGKHKDGSPALDIDSLYQELADARIGGWLGLKAVEACTLSDWSAAMEIVISQERHKQQDVDRFDITNRIDR
jgi:hypothetical protein